MHIKNIACLTLLTGSGISFSGAALAADSISLRQEGSHEHGHLLLNIAVDGSEVTVEIESPAFNLLGFEHSPETAEEIAAVEAVQSQLATYQAFLEFENSDCIQTSPSGKFNITGMVDDHMESEEHLDHDHEEHHDHDEHEADHDDHDHAEEHQDIHVSYSLECSLADRLSVTFTGFEKFSGISEVEVQWITDTGQGREVLMPDNRSFDLR